MTSPEELAEIVGQINAAREQSYENIALTQAHVNQANSAASSAAQDRAIVQGLAQQTVSVDTSVGTRVFAGDTMIFGDTGWRSLPFMDNWTGVCRVRRVGSFVEARLEDVRKIDPSIQGVNVVTLPVGWRLTNPASLPSIHRVPFITNNSGLAENYAYIAANGVYLRVTETSGNTGNAILGYTVDQSWPTELPGTPA